VQWVLRLITILGIFALSLGIAVYLMPIVNSDNSQKLPQMAMDVSEANSNSPEEILPQLAQADVVYLGETQ